MKKIEDHHTDDLELTPNTCNVKSTSSGLDSIERILEAAVEDHVSSEQTVKLLAFWHGNPTVPAALPEGEKLFES